MIRRAVARKFRRLTVADASSAQRLCEGVYDGRDEVPQHIASWLQNPANVVVLGLEHDETLVGFCAAHAYHGQNYMVARSLRLHESVRGQRVGAQLTRASINLAHQVFSRRHGESKRVFGAVDTERCARAKYSYLGGTWNELYRTAYVCVNFSKESLRSLETDNNWVVGQRSCIATPHQQTMLQVLQAKPKFLSGVVLRHSQPFILDEDGVGGSIDYDHFWVTSQATPANSVSCGSGLKNSFSNLITWAADVYCSTAEDLPFHAVEQFKLGYKYANGKPFLFDFHVPERFAHEIEACIRKMLHVETFARRQFSNVAIEYVEEKNRN
ncbi:uncharacterized protein [Oscarella lobularis]|uniref:uncharacterized protein isoform X2 n=1 Tax=Oscarella lobularis TaxID=121494 RepID=UPI003313E744